MDAAGLLKALGAGRSRRYLAGGRLAGQIAESAGIAPAPDAEAPLQSQRETLIVALAERARQGV